MSARRENPRRRAFTLVELLVVVLLLGIAACLVGVRLESATDAAALRAATLTLENTLRSARQFAASRHAPVILRLEHDPPRARFEAGEYASSWQSLAPCRVSAVRRIESSESGDPFTVRVLPSNFCVPWAVELQRGAQTRVAWSQPIAPDLLFQDGTTLDRTPWGTR